jgi:hypothetical protein
MISQISEYRFTSPEMPILSVSMPLAEIADRFGFTMEAWEEDGLGPACGVFVRFPSERVMFLRELKHAIAHLGAVGPTVWVDASQIAAFGVEPLVTEFLESFGLQRYALSWVASDDSRGVAAQVLAKMKSG